MNVLTHLILLISFIIVSISDGETKAQSSLLEVIECPWMCSLDMQRTQGPDHSPPGPLLRLVFAVNNSEEERKSPTDRELPAWLPKLNVPLLNTAHLVWRLHDDFRIPCGTRRAWEPTHTNMKLWIILVLWIIKPFVRDLGFLSSMSIYETARG